MQSVVSLLTTYLPYFILVLTLLVFVHEFGHYWVGRRFGVHAEVFSIERAGGFQRSRSAAT